MTHYRMARFPGHELVTACGLQAYDLEVTP
jgi:hypothetical protein